MRGAFGFGLIVELIGCGSAASDPAQEARTLPAVEAARDDAGADVIAVLPDSELARMLGPDTPVDLFVALAEVNLARGESSLWEMSTEPATDEEVAAVAGALGIVGEIRDGDPNAGLTHVVGSLDDEVGQLSVADFAEPTWGMLPSQQSLERNASNDLDEAASKQVIEEAVHDVLTVVGAEPADLTVDSYVSGSVADVRVEFTPGGVRTDVTWNFAIGSDGTVISGGGPLRLPLVVGTVATIGLDETLLRLSRVSPGVPQPTFSVESLPGEVIPPTTVAPRPPAVDDAGNPVVTAPPPTPPAGPITLPTITAVEPGLLAVWDVTNRQWLVPAVVVSGDGGFTTTIPIIASDHVRIAGFDEVEVPVRTGPPLTIPESEILPNGPATTIPVPPPTSIGAPPEPDTTPPPPPSTTTVGSSGSTLPRPTVPATPVTLLTPDGTPITIPIPPDPNDVATDQIPGYYEESLDAFLAGRGLTEAVDLLERTGWIVRTDGLDDSNQTFTSDLRIGRATAAHRDGIVVRIAVG